MPALATATSGGAPADSGRLPRAIVAGVDGRSESLDAVALAARIAVGMAGRLVVVAAYPLAPLSSRILDAGPTDRAEARRALDQVRRALGRTTADLLALGGSSPGRTLHEAAEAHGADLIVVGSSHHGPRGRVVLGGVTAETLRRSPCAVAVAPRGWAEGARSLVHIGVAVDGSPRDVAAAAMAARIARMSEPPGIVQAIHVQDPATTGTGAEPNATARAAAAMPPEVAVRSVVVTGEVADELAARSGELDMLVLGARPRGVPGLLLGDMTARVMGLARCPVLVLPSEPASPALTAKRAGAERLSAP